MVSGARTAAHESEGNINGNDVIGVYGNDGRPRRKVAR